MCIIEIIQLLFKNIIFLLVFKRYALLYLTVLRTYIQSLIIGNIKQFLTDHKIHHLLFHKRMNYFLLVRAIISKVETLEYVKQISPGLEEQSCRHTVFYYWQNRILEFTDFECWPVLSLIIIFIRLLQFLFKGPYYICMFVFLSFISSSVYAALFYSLQI